MNILYLRTDFWFNLTGGGSVAHTRGVIGGFAELGHETSVITSGELYGIRGVASEIHVVSPVPRRQLLGLNPLYYNLFLYPRLTRHIRRRRPDFLYQRHAAFSAAGAWLAKRSRIPLIVEVNDLVVRWAKQRNAPLALSSLADRIERTVFRTASLLTTVSDVLRDQLLDAGVPKEKILVNPNGVDTNMFQPDCAPAALPIGNHAADRKIVGWVGTFGSWHGVEVLAEAIPLVLRQCPAAHFLLIGDGGNRREVELMLARNGSAASVTFVGAVPHDQAPGYLAACDLFVSPHPKPKSGRFIGSPTKLFEYMAMGRGIVASSLDQIKDVLGDGAFGLLVEPGDPAALANGIVSLLQDPDRALDFGRKARAAAVRHYSWKDHSRRILCAAARCAC